MIKRHFFESIERDNNYQMEYEKLEKLCSEDFFSYGKFVSINSWISDNFWNWKKRSNYISFEELREQLGFPLGILVKDIDLNKYCLFAEMLVNLVVDLESVHNYSLDKVIGVMFENIQVTLSKAGLELKRVGESVIVVAQNIVAIEAADIVPDLADSIIEYNHYLLKGDLERKQELLKKIADALEPNRKTLSRYAKNITDDYFYMINNMNVRHNNCCESDTKKYNSKFASLTIDEKEKWYDIIYEQGLTLFVMLEQQRRDKIIDTFKRETNLEDK